MRYSQRSAPPPGAEPDEFVMSDASIDRMGDVIEQDGWQLDNFRKHPVALWNHNRDAVIGRWVDVGVRNGRLTGRLEFAEAGTSPLIDTLRSLHRQKYLRAVSVGFRALEHKPLNEKSAGLRFLKSELLECSLVSIPANPSALAIVKDLPRDVFDQIFGKTATEDLAAPGAFHRKPANELVTRKATNMNSTISQRIQGAQNDLQILRDALNELLAKDELTADESTRYDELPGRIEAAKKELEKHQRAERALIDGSGTVERMTVRDSDVIPMPRPEAGMQPPLQLPAPMRVYAQPKKRLEPSDLLIRSLVCWASAEGSHERDLGKALRDKYQGDELTGQVLRAVTNPAMTSVATWAAELTDSLTTTFLDRLVPASIYSQLSGMGVKYTFGNASQLKIPVRQAIAIGSPGNLAGAWVGEGGAKPVRRASFATVSLVPNKLAVISTFTEEMATYSPYAIEAIIRQAMSDDTSIALDSYLIDNVAGSATRPAGLLNAAAWGTGTVAPSAATPASAAMVADLKALVAALTALNGGRRVAILLNPAQALALGFAQTTTGDFLFTDRQQAGSKFGVSFIVSNSVPAARVIAVDAEDFATATGDAPRFAVSTDATLHEEDTAPLPLSATGSPNTVAAPMRSLFQTDAVAVRMTLYVSWAMRRSGMVQTMSPVIW